jgi:hypothetical protein
MKRKEVMYCIDGYHSYRSVEHPGLIGLMQTCVDFGAKYGKFDVKDAMTMRKAVTKETASLALKTKEKLRSELIQPVDDGTVSLCIDMYTDDYQKRAYLDVHASWIDSNFQLKHAALAVRHFGTASHTAINIAAALTEILTEFGLSENDTPFTTDHGSNIVAALHSNIRLDCVCHRLHTVLETAWRETKRDNEDAAKYETAVSDLCRFAKQSTGVQEQLPKSLKHGGDTRPWVAMYRRSDSVESSFDALVPILTAKGRLDLIGNVSRSLNLEILSITKCVKTVFESLEKVNEPTLQLVAPSYYLLMKKLAPPARESNSMRMFRDYMRKYLDEKFYTSIKALHWIATFLDPTFKQMEFIPQVTAADVHFRRNLLIDLDGWILAEMQVVQDKMERNELNESVGLELYIYIF